MLDLSADGTVRLQEIPSSCWNLRLLETPIDRTSKTVGDLAKEYGIAWHENFSRAGAAHLFKAEVRDSNRFFDPILAAFVAIERKTYANPVLLIGEPRHKASAYYRSADPLQSLVAAPGKTFKRLVLAQVWKEPHLQTWSAREDAFVWFGLPYPERVALAKKVVSWGVDLHVYSREVWPIPGYKGPADDEYRISLGYKYRLAVENSSEYLYHSEKLLQSHRAGCVTFFVGDPNLDLRHADGTFLPLTQDTVKRREKLAADVIAAQKEYLFGSGWEFYSYKRMANDIFELVVDTVRKNKKRA